jgi:diadenylate cyclase
MDLISRFIADFILFIGHQAQVFWSNLALLNFSWQQIGLDILLVAVFFYFVLRLIKGSRALHILIGLVVVSVIYLISRTMQLVTLAWLLEKFLTVTLIAIPVIFQQELRMALEKLGHTKLFLKQNARQIDKMIINIVQACETLAAAHKGALIVIQNAVPLKEFTDTGISLDAKISRELILSIFNPASPLHDGAIIIKDQKIVAASCILPHSSRSDGSVMGTRHKAALGLSENTDAGVVVVSEEKGAVSFAIEGEIERNIKPERLHELLISLLNPGKYKKINQQQIFRKK